MTSDIPQYYNPLTFGSISCVTSHTETLNCDISSLENDTEMVDHSMNPEFSGALLMNYVTLVLIKARKNYLFS